MDATPQPSGCRHENLEVLFSTQLVREGGWLHLSTGPLSVLVPNHVRHIGTDRFFELL